MHKTFQMLVAGLLGLTLFSSIAVMAHIRGLSFVLINKLEVCSCLLTSSQILPLALGAEFRVGGGLQGGQRLACHLQLTINKLMVRAACHVHLEVDIVTWSATQAHDGNVLFAIFGVHVELDSVWKIVTTGYSRSH